MTAGESHGKALVAILDGMVANLPLSAEDLSADLARRQEGYGRGARMQIEKDQAEILLRDPVRQNDRQPDLTDDPEPQHRIF